MSTIHVLRMCVSVLALTLPNPTIAQVVDWTQPNRVPVAIVAKPDAAYNGADFLILRRAVGDPNDVILVPSTHVSAKVLTDAIWALLAERSINGDRPRADGTMRLKTRTKAQLPWVGRVTARMKTAQAVDVPGIGRYPALMIFLPAQVTSNRQR